MFHVGWQHIVQHILQKGFPLMANHIMQLFHRQSSIMRVLTNIDLACLKSMPVHLSIECRIAEPRLSGKPTIIIREKMLEIVANSYCIWLKNYKVSSSSLKYVGKAQDVELIDGCPTARRPWYFWGWLMRLDCRTVSCSGQCLEQRFLQGDSTSCRDGNS